MLSHAGPMIVAEDAAIGERPSTARRKSETERDGFNVHKNPVFAKSREQTLIERARRIF